MSPIVRMPLPDYPWEEAEEDPDAWQDDSVPVNIYGETDEGDDADQ